MTKQVLVNVDGNIEALLQLWRPMAGVEFTASPGSLEVVFPAGHLEAYELLQAAAAQLPADTVSVVTFFQAFDFSDDDRNAAPLNELRVVTNPGLQPISDLPIDSSACPRCLSPGSIVNPVAELVFASNANRFELLLGYDLYKLAHRRLLEKIQDAGLTGGLATTPCRILTPGTSNSDYVWLRGTHDLGLPTGRVEYEPPCPKCGQRNFSKNENFLTTFSVNGCKGTDFATSSFYGPAYLAVSQRVYRFLQEQRDLPPSTIFEPLQCE